MITVGGLFSGIGGLELGLQRAGMVIKWMCEIDPYCQQVLAKHWPDVRRYADVRDVGAHNLESVDLICGGFPCQPHSTAGKRRGAADDRNLWPEFIRIVKELRPHFVLGENVPGIRTTMLDTVLSDLEGEGYTCGTFNIPACAFDAPHRRERIWILAYAGWLGNEPDGTSRKRFGTSRRVQGALAQQRLRPAVDNGSPDVSDSNGRRCEQRDAAEWEISISNAVGMWPIEPAVGRVADGVPHRVDRLRALGNAVVPQVAEWIGRRIVTMGEAQP